MDASSCLDMATQTPTPIQSSISADLERELREIQTSSHTGPPGDLDDKKKRWLVVGICLHDILSPSLRKYVDPVVKTLYNALKRSDQIDIQTQTKYLRKYGAANIYLNYEAINNNKATHGHRLVLYDYKVQNAVDLSKLFLQTHMSHYTAFDETCDSSALLGMINKIDKFPLIVQTAANDVRSTLRNEWAHCNFSVWDNVKYVQSLQLIEDLIYILNLNAADEKQMIGELQKWRKNGTSFLQGYTISFELVNEIRQKLQVLVEYAEVISKTADIEFGKVHELLVDIAETLSQDDKRISTLENTVATQEKTLKEYGSLYAGKTYVPSKVNISSKNGLYEVQTYNPTIDPFEKKKTNTLSEPTDPFKQMTGYSPTRTTDDITKRKIEDYQGHKYDTFYDYGFPNDKDKEKRKQKPKEPKPKSEPKVDRKPKHVERAESPFPYNASKSVSRTFMLMTKGNRVRPEGTSFKTTDEFD